MKYILSALILICNISIVMGLTYGDIIVDGEKSRSVEIPKRHCVGGLDLNWDDDCQEALMLYLSGNRAALLDETYKELIKAIKTKDVNAIEKLMAYPLEVRHSQYYDDRVAGDVTYIKNKKEFLMKFDQIFTPQFFKENEKRTVFGKIAEPMILTIPLDYTEVEIYLSCKNDSIYLNNENLDIFDIKSKFLDYAYHVETCPDPEAKIHLILTYDKYD